MMIPRTSAAPTHLIRSANAASEIISGGHELKNNGNTIMTANTSRIITAIRRKCGLIRFSMGNY